MVQTTAKGYPYPGTSDSPHGPDQLQNLAARADELTHAARMTETERDALAAPDLYDGRVVMIVDSNGVWQRIEIYHADDPADPDAGGTWKILVDRAFANATYATKDELDNATPQAGNDVVESGETTTSTTFTDLTTVGPSVTVTVGPQGFVLAMWAAWINPSSGEEGAVSPEMTGAVPANPQTARSIRHASTDGDADRLGAHSLVIGTPGEDVTVTLKYQSSGGTVAFAQRELTVMTW